MARSSFAYIPGFSVKFFFQPIYTDYPFFYFELGGHLGWKLGSPDTNLEGGHPRIISAKFG
jgi:hypothetical protein